MTHEETTAADDATLAHAWVAGDERGYNALVTRYAALVYGRCRRALGAVDADDATQAVFLVLARKRAQAAASPAFAAWLLTVAEFVICNAKRDRKRQRIVASPDQLPLIPAPEPTMMDIQEHLDACLDELPAAEREAVRLHYLARHTLAEVAAHTGVPLSTVHDRVRRGLERMKTLMARRGVHAASLAVLIACVQAEAAASVPSGLMASLRDLAPPGGGAGATAAISPRALHWSLPRLSPMSRITIAAAILLSAGIGALLVTRTAEPQPPHSLALDPAVAAVPAAPPVTVPEFDLDPERAHGWVTLRWVDGARTAERLRRLPELALLAEAAPAALETIAGLRAAQVLLRPDDALPHEQRVRQYTFQREMLRLTSEQQVQRALALYNAAIEDARATTATGGATGADVSLLAGSAGEFEFASPEAQQFFVDRLNRGWHAPFFTITTSADGWQLGEDGQARLLRSGKRSFALRGSLPPLAPDPLAGPWPASDHDVELTSWLDTGLPGSAPLRANTVSLTVLPDGMRLASYGAWQTAHDRQQAEAWPRLDPTRLDAIPANAFLVCAVPMTAKNTAASVFLQTLLLGTYQALTEQMRAFALQTGAATNASPEQNPQARILTALITTLRQIDGVMVAWVEPGMPVPAITVEMDMPLAAADTLIAATGAARAADGSVTEYLGMIAVTMGWQDGRLIITTLPGGLAAIDRRGGFTTHPEVRRALAAMPSRQPNLCVLLRPTALIECVAPFAAMVDPNCAPRLSDYAQRLQQDSAYAFLSVAGDAQGLRIDAAGLLSLVAAGVLGATVQSPHRISN